MRRAAATDLIAFLGPSLPAAEARKIAKCTVLPPARQGDVWRALLLRPRAIALIDGVFEAQPSVWHRELCDALDSGVRVFGASSMGALRAAELRPQGMVGVGQVYRWLAGGSADDADVALLHADAEHGFRPLTVPQVTVRFAAAEARKAGVLPAGAARKLVAASASIFYQARTWAAALAALGPSDRRRWDRWAAAGVPDVKALDARACLAKAAEACRDAPAKAGRPARRAAPDLGRLDPRPSALVRRRKLRDAMPGALEALLARPDAADLRDAGLRRALLAGRARELGVRASPAEVAAAERDWLRSLGVPKKDRAAFLAASGLDEIDALRLCEEVALERRMLRDASKWIADGPAADEAIAAEARLRGHWAALPTKGH